MLTTEQKSALYRLQGQEGLLSALINEVKENLAFQIIETAPQETNKREHLFKMVNSLDEVNTILKQAIQSYKNSI